MSDQAATLRVIRGGARATEPPGPPQRRAIAVSGGKGGVGKSTVALNVALALARDGHRTLMVDTDLGMADLNLLLGVAPDHSILDALGGLPIEDVLVAAHGIDLLPALNGSYLLATLGPAGHARILELVGSLVERYEALVIDIAAGIGQAQTVFAGAATDALVVVNPEPLSMADAYASLKVLATEQAVHHAFVVPNRVRSPHQAHEVTSRLQALVDRFLDIELTPLPAIPWDPAVTEAAHYGVPLLVHAPEAPAARAIKKLVRALATLAPSAARSHWWRAPARGEAR